MDVNTTYLCQSNSLRPHLGHRQQTREISSNLVMATREGHQDEQGEPLDRWETRNTEYDHREKLKWKEDQLLRDSGQRKINILDEMWRLFTNVPTTSVKKNPTWK